MQQFERKEVVALLIGALLGVAGILVEDVMFASGLIVLAAALGCYAVYAHRKLGISWRIFFCVLLLCGSAAVLWRLYSRYEKKELSANEGDLVAANESPLPNECHLLPKGDIDKLVKLHFGSLTAPISAALPYVVLSLGGRPILVINRTEFGAVTLSLDLFDEHGDVMVSIDRGHYLISDTTVFRKVQKDWSGFQLYAKRGNTKFLDLRIVNDKEIFIAGTLLYKPGVYVDDNGLYVGSNSFVGPGCVFNPRLNN